MKPKDKGALGELRVAAKLIELGYPVFKEIANNSKVDLIILVGNKPVKIQVKTTTSIENEIAILPTRKCTLNKKYNYKYNEEDVDIFILWVEDKEDLLIVSSKEATKLASLKFRYSKTSRKGGYNIRYASEYRDIEKTINGVIA